MQPWKGSASQQARQASGLAAGRLQLKAQAIAGGEAEQVQEALSGNQLHQQQREETNLQHRVASKPSNKCEQQAG